MGNDKCDLCDLKVIFDQKTLNKERNIENLLDTLRCFQKNKIIEKGYERRIFVGDSSGEDAPIALIGF
ncbi:MAG: hypothetical protein V3U02_02050 [Calditrichia bacterium]